MRHSLKWMRGYKNDYGNELLDAIKAERMLSLIASMLKAGISVILIGKPINL